MRSSVFLLLLVVVLSGCVPIRTEIGPITGTPYSNYGTWPNSHAGYEREKYVYDHPELPKSLKESILRGKLQIGMTKEQVLATRPMDALKNPTDVQKSHTIHGTLESWYWQKNSGHVMLYVSFDENGHLSYWNED